MTPEFVLNDNVMFNTWASTILFEIHKDNNSGYRFVKCSFNDQEFIPQGCDQRGCSLE